MSFVETEDMNSVATKDMSFVETEDMSFVATGDMAIVETEDMFQTTAIANPCKYPPSQLRRFLTALPFRFHCLAPGFGGMAVHCQLLWQFGSSGRVC